MAYEKKDGDISLFPNDKQGNEKRPDYKGTVLIGGTEYEVAMWKRTSSKGNEFLSGTAKPTQGEKKEPNKEEQKPQFVDDAIPF